MQPDKRLKLAASMCSCLFNPDTTIDFSIEKGGGGNWDDNSIEKICKRFGISLDLRECLYSKVKRPIRDNEGPLELVKSLRNQLAHGEISFVQCSENTEVSALMDLKDVIVSYLKELITVFETYIDEKQYLRENA